LVRPDSLRHSSCFRSSGNADASVRAHNAVALSAPCPCGRKSGATVRFKLDGLRPRPLRSGRQMFGVATISDWESDRFAYLEHKNYLGFRVFRRWHGPCLHLFMIANKRGERLLRPTFQRSSKRARKEARVSASGKKRPLVRETADLTLRCFRFDRSVVVKQLYSLSRALSVGAREIEMVAAERVFDKSFSSRLASTARDSPTLRETAELDA
jgi:hypothetical protein